MARFDGVRPHVPVEVAAAAVAAAREAGADVLLSVGGGSTTGTAKAVALASGLPILAVPTTYAGSEMTPVWGSTEAGRKTTGRDLAVLPKVVVYDPELTLSLPAWITAASGMNAIAHCVEAPYAPGRNPVTTQLAWRGSGRRRRRCRRWSSARDVAARAGALYGAYLAGSAFAVAGSGLHHKICHALGGAFDLPHAETHSVVLPHVVAFQQPAAAAAMDRSRPRSVPGPAPRRRRCSAWRRRSACRWRCARSACPPTGSTRSSRRSSPRPRPTTRARSTPPRCARSSPPPTTAGDPRRPPPLSPPTGRFPRYSSGNRPVGTQWARTGSALGSIAGTPGRSSAAETAAPTRKIPADHQKAVV